jgi:hypothetical protein
MPTITQSISPLGPVIDVWIGVTEARANILLAEGGVVPNWQAARLLIDTGASNTCIDPCVIAPLGLTPTGVAQVQTPSTEGKHHEVPVYDLRLILHAPNVKAPGTRFFDALPVMACQLESQGIQGLLGRDILEHCTLVYNGDAGVWMLCF